MPDGAVIIAAITSCTNTSNPRNVIAAGLLARNAHRLGLTRKPWVKSSLAPGSKAVTLYLEEAGLMQDLENWVSAWWRTHVLHVTVCLAPWIQLFSKKLLTVICTRQQSCQATVILMVVSILTPNKPSWRHLHWWWLMRSLAQFVSISKRCVGRGRWQRNSLERYLA